MANAIKQRLARVLAREFHRDGDYDMAEADEQKQFQNAAAAVLAELAGELRDCDLGRATFPRTENRQFTQDEADRYKRFLDDFFGDTAIDEARHG